MVCVCVVGCNPIVFEEEEEKREILGKTAIPLKNWGRRRSRWIYCKKESWTILAAVAAHWPNTSFPATKYALARA